MLCQPIVSVSQASDEDGPRGAATALRRKALADRLIHAAEATIAAAGLQALRARTLAEAVGCSVGAIYGVFPDLDALILAVNSRTLEAIDAALRQAAGPAEPVAQMVALAEAYLDFAATNPLLWGALFQHRLPEQALLPPSYLERRDAVFAHVERPLAALQPGLPGPPRALLARTLFAAVHGMVALGLEEKVTALPLESLRDQIRLVVTAMARGL